MDGGKIDRVWVPDPVDGYRLGVVVDVGAESLTIKLQDAPQGTTVAPYDEVFPALDDGTDVDDNCALVSLNEATLLQNVRQRYYKNKIYTYVANILLAVNPYWDIPSLYSSKTMFQYRGRSLGVLPPHVFAIADKVYRAMRASKESQSIVISGESGAGKTESTKYVLRYLTECYGAEAGIIEKRIVEANPLLESFGNAKTSHNHNSSRFGKFVEIHFNETYTVVGGHVSHYLLEKSRVCSQQEQERNYHIFYQLLAGAPKQTKDALGLGSANDYSYLNPKTIRDPTIDDVKEYHHLKASMDSVGMTPQEQGDLFRVVAAVLRLGNVCFKDDTSDRRGGSTCSPSSWKTLESVSELLGLEVEELSRSLTSRVMTTTKKRSIGTVINVPLKPEQAASARDALAKALYVRLFSWIVGRVNKCFPFKSSRYYIGVLDIAGFEFYEFNSFEQFCINYCNEKLQQLFHYRILKEEQELYKREELGVAEVRFMDNQDCIDLIEKRGRGIIDLLDEECRLPRASNEHFTAAVHHRLGGHFRLVVPRRSKLSQHRSLRDEEGFLIRHFAGAVCYRTAFFLEKNNDSLHASLEQLVATSDDPFVQDLFEETASGRVDSTSMNGSFAKKLTLDSISSKFRIQLEELMKKLRSTGSSFIRCLKPNPSMAVGKFVGGQVLSQLRCAGMISVLELMEGGFPSRAQFIDLYKMYKSYLPPKLVWLDPRTFCQALFRALGMRKTDFRFGNSKVFFRAGKFSEFDQIMRTDPESLKTMVLKVEHWLVAKQWRKVIYGAITVQKLARKIRYRRENTIKVQSIVRAILAMKQHRPRYRGLVRLRHLQSQSDQVLSIVAGIKKDRDVLRQRLTKTQADIDQLIRQIKSSLNMSSEGIKKECDDLTGQVEDLFKELLVRQEQQKMEEKESEKVCKLQEEMEKERHQRQQEEEKRRREEEAQKQRQELEAQHQAEEEKRKAQERTDNLLMAQLTLEEIEKQEEQMMAFEQERRDFEMAFRLARTQPQSQAVIEEHMKQKEQLISRSQGGDRLKRSAAYRSRHTALTKQHNLTKWKFAQLRDTINTSCELSLLEACRDELHRRLRVYHAWKDKYQQQSQAQATQNEPQSVRVPQEIAANADTYADSEQTSVEDSCHRYFRVPFLRPAPANQTDKRRGWWYAHFRGAWIVRQMELHPDCEPLLLLAGKDDMEMCELSLEETGLTRKKNAEITEHEFEEVWSKHGGQPLPPYTSNGI